jgi:hypothetical protein
LAKTLTFLGRTLLIPLLALTEYSSNAGFQRPLLFKSAAEQVDAERMKFIRHKPFKNLKRARSFGGDEGSLPRGKQMAD